MGDARPHALGLIAALAITSCVTGPSAAPDRDMPAWLAQQISDGLRPPRVIERVIYDGLPAYHVLTGPADAGDEHGLFLADGTLVCRFGGFAGRVSSGSCELDRIEYVSTVYRQPWTNVPNLVERRERLSGRQVTSVGYLVANSRSVSLFSEAHTDSVCLGVFVSGDLYHSLQQLDGQWVSVRGTLDAHACDDGVICPRTCGPAVIRVEEIVSH